MPEILFQCSVPIRYPRDYLYSEWHQLFESQVDLVIDKTFLSPMGLEHILHLTSFGLASSITVVLTCVGTEGAE